MLSSELSRLLQSSGAGGVFLTPKSKDASGPSTEFKFKVIWGDSDDLSKDLIVARTSSAIFGVVKGRDCLGWRVKVKDYAAVRKVIEPTWQESKNLWYDIPIGRKFTLAPLPQDVDREALQQILMSFAWEAVPLRQVNALTWVVGFNDSPPKDVVHVGNTLVLIREDLQRPKAKPENAVVSAPTPVRRALEVQLHNHGARPRPTQSAVATNPAPPVVRQAVGPHQFAPAARR